MLLLAPAAHAAFGVESFDARVVDDEGNLFEQAGGHPFEGYTAFALNTLPSGAPDGHVKDIRVDVPPGLISNPQAVPMCSDAQLAISACPANAQLGRVNLTTFMGLRVGLELPLYNMTIGPNQVSRFAFNPQQALLGAPGAILGRDRRAARDHAEARRDPRRRARQERLRALLHDLGRRRQPRDRRLAPDLLGRARLGRRTTPSADASASRPR